MKDVFKEEQLIEERKEKEIGEINEKNFRKTGQLITNQFPQRVKSAR